MWAYQFMEDGMWCSKYHMDGTVMKLCPVSLGIAIGIVSFFAVLIWSLWVILYGMPPTLAAMHVPIPTVGMAFVHALLALVKGFLFGFFVGLIYDLIVCCKCCRKRDETVPPSSPNKI